MKNKTTICQSCSMPMSKPENYGTNADGSQSHDYCVHCYTLGKFNSPDETMEEMIESCIPFVLNDYPDEDSAREGLYVIMPKLKRWQ